MRILVCISSVPDTTSKINFTEGNRTFDTTGVQFIINPNDEYGLNKAISLKEKLGGSVTLLNVGTAETEPVLRKAFAVGADEIIRVNACPSSGYEVATQISKVVQEGKFDLIITGKESIDYNGGMVGAMLSAMLDYPFVNRCIELEINGLDVSAVSEIEGGKERISAKLPLVVASQKGLVEEKELRIPNMRNLMAARTKQITVIEPVSVSSGVEISAFEKLPAKNPVKMISPDNLDELINLLHTQSKVI